MELVLLKDVTHVGRKGEIVRVRDGYARNFLIPRKLGISATDAGKEFIKLQQEKRSKRAAQEKKEAEAIAQKLKKEKMVLQAKVGEKEKLFGSVTAEDLSKALGEKGYSVTKKQIIVKDPIRTVGTHAVVVELYPQVKTEINIEVAPKP